jgi:putative addiction module antidote
MVYGIRRIHIVSSGCTWASLSERSDIVSTRLGAQRVRRTGNSFVVTIPKEQVERLGLNEGDYVDVSIQPLELRPRLNPELRAVFEEVWKENEAGLRYLADHD